MQVSSVGIGCSSKPWLEAQTLQCWTRASSVGNRMPSSGGGGLVGVGGALIGRLRNRVNSRTQRDIVVLRARTGCCRHSFALECRKEGIVWEILIVALGFQIDLRSSWILSIDNRQMCLTYQGAWEFVIHRYVCLNLPSPFRASHSCSMLHLTKRGSLQRKAIKKSHSFFSLPNRNQPGMLSRHNDQTPYP